MTRDGQTLATFDTEGQAWGYLQRIQGNSVQWAIMFEGYDIIYPQGHKASRDYGDRRGN